MIGFRTRALAHPTTIFWFRNMALYYAWARGLRILIRGAYDHVLISHTSASPSILPQMKIQWHRIDLIRPYVGPTIQREREFMRLIVGRAYGKLVSHTSSPSPSKPNNDCIDAYVKWNVRSRRRACVTQPSDWYVVSVTHCRRRRQPKNQ